MADVSVFRGGIDVGGQPFLRCWHAETDTLPWVQRRPDDPATADVVLLFGVYSPVREAPQVRVAVDLPAEHRDYGPDDGVEALTYSSIARRVRRHHRLRGEPGVLERRHHYVDVEAASLDQQQINAYFRVTVARVPLDALVRYTVTVSSPMSALLPGAPVASAAFQLRASAPEFDGDDVCAAGDGQWALLYRRENDFDHVRLDLLSAIGTDQRARPDAGLQIGDAPAVEANTGWGDRPAAEFVDVPLIDREVDSILVSAPVPADKSRPLVHVRTAGAAFPSVVDTSARIKPVLLMLINYCIQGLNDLFEAPVGHYDPPRTYMQVTMRDERGAWSSRPGSAEDGDPDGYGLTLDAHRFYRVPSMWAFNAAVLTMIAHDCPDELARLRSDIRAGLLVPVNAGFGAHRPPYYDEETNRQEIRRGQQAITGFLPEAPAAGLGVYYPDQRLYEATPAEVAVYADDSLVTHLVLDRSTLCKLDPDHPGEQIQFFPGADPRANRLLRDPATKRHVLPIEDAVRDGIIASGDDCLRGKADPRLRGLFLQALPSQDQNLFVYADDADKASGCGWFDGDYAGNPVHFNEGYQATLCWLSRHPWVRRFSSLGFVCWR